MYKIDSVGCATGYGFVRDYVGNIWFYGTVEKCQEFIERMVKANVSDLH